MSYDLLPIHPFPLLLLEVTCVSFTPYHWVFRRVAPQIKNWMHLFWLLRYDRLWNKVSSKIKPG